MSQHYHCSLVRTWGRGGTKDQFITHPHFQNISLLQKEEDLECPPSACVTDHPHTHTFLSVRVSGFQESTAYSEFRMTTQISNIFSPLVNPNHCFFHNTFLILLIQTGQHWKIKPYFKPEVNNPVKEQNNLLKQQKKKPHTFCKSEITL